MVQPPDPALGVLPTDVVHMRRASRHGLGRPDPDREEALVASSSKAKRESGRRVSGRRGARNPLDLRSARLVARIAHPS